MTSKSTVAATFGLVILLSGCGVTPAKPNHPWSVSAAPPTVKLDAYKNPNLRGPYQNPDLSVAVALSGGGSRAANLAAGVLMGMEEITSADAPRTIRSNLLLEIDYFSTASGGGLAAGIYLEALHRYLEYGGDPGAFRFVAQFERGRDHCADATTLRRELERGYHHNVLAGFFEPKILLTNSDRGDALEKEFNLAILGAACRDKYGELVLGDFFVPIESNADPDLPMWVANATVFQNGWIFPFAPNVLREYGINGYWHNLVYATPSAGALDSDHFPASVGLKASGSFPVFLPASSLSSDRCEPRKCFVQLMDGGLSDNLGFVTALNLLMQDGAADPRRKKLLIVVDAFAGDLVPFGERAGPPLFVEALSRATEINKDSFRGLISHNPDFFARIKDQNLKVLYLTIDTSDRLRKVHTKYDVTPRQQDELIRCGKSLIEQQREGIVAWLEDKPDHVVNNTALKVVSGSMVVGRVGCE